MIKRSRYYQSLIDSSLLEPGSVDFNGLNDTCIIMITPFDLFGAGKYRYTFSSCCVEDKGISLNDGAVRIFLNTKGENDHEVSQELIDFLHYIECTEEELALRSGSENIRKIHECVKRIKSSEEIGVKYMQTWEEKVYEREKGKTEGRVEGKVEDILCLLEEIGELPEDLRKRITDQRDYTVLTKWLKLAARSGSIEEFCEKITDQD